MLKAIHAQEDLTAAQDKAGLIVDKLKAMMLAQATKLVEQHITRTLTYYQFPPIHWLKLKTNNPLERIMHEIRRRTRVVETFPDGNSALMLCAARKLIKLRRTTKIKKRKATKSPKCNIM